MFGVGFPVVHKHKISLKHGGFDKKCRYRNPLKITGKDCQSFLFFKPKHGCKMCYACWSNSKVHEMSKLHNQTRVFSG